MRINRRLAAALLWLALFSPFLARAQDTDGDGIIDRNDNCSAVANPTQSDLTWNTQSGTMVLFDDSLAGMPWYNSPELTGATVHDGDTALRITGNQYIQNTSPSLGTSGPQRYLRFWVFLASADADLALQMNCGDGAGWDHKWGFSGDGSWSGEPWSFQGVDYNLPVGRWVPVMLDLQGTISCDNGSAIYGIGWSVKSGDAALIDSAAFYSSSPRGDACEDSDRDGLMDSAEIDSTLTDPGLFDTDLDGVGDGTEFWLGADPLNPAITPAGLGVEIGDDIRLTTSANSSTTPTSVVWTGSEFAVSWSDQRDGNLEIYFARFSAAGVKIGGDLRVTNNAAASELPSLAWNGSEFGLSWMDLNDGNYEIYFTRVSAAGEIIGANTRLTSNSASSQSPSVAWSNSEFGVTWMDNRDGNYEIYFCRVSGAGAKIGSDIRLTSAGQDSGDPNLIWNGSEYAYTWNDWRNFGSEIYFGRIAADGVKIGGDLRITYDALNSYSPTIAWTGSEYHVAWDDQKQGYGTYAVYFHRVSAGGALAGSEVRLTTNSPPTSAQPVLAWTGSESGIFWVDWRDTGSSSFPEIFFSRISAAGVEQGDDSRVTSDPAQSQGMAQVWTGSEFGATWIDARSGTNEVFFTRVGWTDGDGDGLDPADESLSGTDPADWDTDGDGLSDGYEVNTSLSDPLDPDTDDDTLNDGMEVNLTGTSPLLADTDGDGLTDDEEINTYLTDPTDADTDDEGLWDGDEVSVYHTDPLLADTDDDGANDYIEVLLLQSDPHVADTDGDGLLDGEEGLIFGTDPNNPDSDADNLSDGAEVNGTHTNPWLADTDGDGLSDFVEGQFGTNPVYHDTNANGIPDGQEAGGRYLDVDGDGMPTTWELDHPCLNAGAADGGTDDDADGLNNLAEFNAGTNPCATDTDNDGFNDSYEINVSLTDPNLEDSDGDGLHDSDEINVRGTNPILPDSDGDGWSDGAEVSEGADPNNPASYPVAQPHLINYQGRLTDNAGVPVNGTMPITFGLYPGATAATPVWTEAQSVTVTNGLYHVLLGSITPISTTLFTSVDPNGGFFLQVTVNGQVLAPRQILASVPMAMFAERLFDGGIQSDTATFSPNGTAKVTVSVAFNKTFRQPPTVFISPPSITLGTERFIGETSNITASGFDVTFESVSGRPAGGMGRFNWLAFGN